MATKNLSDELEACRKEIALDKELLLKANSEIAQCNSKVRELTEENIRLSGVIETKDRVISAITANGVKLKEDRDESRYQLGVVVRSLDLALKNNKSLSSQLDSELLIGGDGSEDQKASR